MTEFVRMDNSIKDAILTIIKYIQIVTGVAPTQNEVAEMLKSYFILNEISNQVKYQLKNALKKENAHQNEIKKPFWTLNLMTGPKNNVLAGAGFFHLIIKEAVQDVRDFVKKTIGVEPSNAILAKSLKSSFILSEVKNQIEWQRKNARNQMGSNNGQRAETGQLDLGDRTGSRGK